MSGLDLATLRGWLDKRGFPVRAPEAEMLRVDWRADFATKAPLPPLYVQLADNWVLLSVLPVEVSPAYALVGLSRALLAFNRKIPVAKFALGAKGEVVLCAELPTESLDEDELLGTMDTLLECLRSYGAYGPPPETKA